MGPVFQAAPDLRCIFGMRGAGKTTWILEHLRTRSNVLVYDVLGKFSEMVVVEDWVALREYFEKGKPERFKVSYRGLDDPEEFSLVCLLVKALGKAYGSITFVVDEVDLFSKANYDPPAFRYLIAQGRNDGVSLICASRTPAEISKLLTSQASHFVCFTMHEKRHLDYLASHGVPFTEALAGSPFHQPFIHEFPK